MRVFKAVDCEILKGKVVTGREIFLMKNCGINKKKRWNKFFYKILIICSQLSLNFSEFSIIFLSFWEIFFCLES